VSKLGRKLRRFARLTGAERVTLAQAWLALLFFDLALRLLPFPTVQRWARTTSGRPRTDLETERKTILLLDIAARHHVLSMTCLRRALALQWLLGRQGVGTELRIGVRPQGSSIAAHAWLEREGRPLGQPPGIAEEYSVLTPGPVTDRP